MKNHILVYFLLTTFSVVFSQKEDTLTAKLKQIQKESGFVGLAVAIFDENRIIYSHGFGYSNKETKKPYDIKTLQKVASVSKTLIAVSLMKSIELGKINLDDDINKYLPYKVYNPFYPDEVITVRNLATHTSSIQNPMYYYSFLYEGTLPKAYKNIDDPKHKKQIKKYYTYLRKFGSDFSNFISIGEFLQQRFDTLGKYYFPEEAFSKSIPGSKYSYSNEAITLLAYIIEQATGETIIDFTQKNILTPLNMSHSYWDYYRFNEKEPLEKSKEYWVGEEMPRMGSTSYPDGEFVTTIEDFIPFMQTMMKGYNGDSNILSKNSYLEMFNCQIDTTCKTRIVWRSTPTEIWHGGKGWGIRVDAGFNPETSIGYLIFCNTNYTPNAEEYNNAIFDLLREYPAQLEKIR